MSPPSIRYILYAHGARQLHDSHVTFRCINGRLEFSCLMVNLQQRHDEYFLFSYSVPFLLISRYFEAGYAFHGMPDCVSFCQCPSAVNAADTSAHAFLFTPPPLRSILLGNFSMRADMTRGIITAYMTRATSYFRALSCHQTSLTFSPLDKPHHHYLLGL